MKKYELVLDMKKEFLGKTLFRIRALISFGSIVAGELGGYIEKESNLDHDNNAWVSGDARVYGNARVYGDARVDGNAWVYGDARVYGNAWVSGDAWVYGNARVYGDARVDGNARVYGNAWVSKFHQTCSVTNLKWSLTSLPKGIQVGCHFHTMKYWKQNHIKIGLENGLTEEQSKAYYQLMLALRKVQHLAGKTK